MKGSTLSVLALSVAFALACGGGSAPTTETTPPPPPPPPVATDGSIGVPECDEWLKKMTECANQMDPAAKPSMEASIKQMRDAWTQAAQTEAGKSGLAMGCKAAVVPTDCGTASTTDAEKAAAEKLAAEEKAAEEKAAAEKAAETKTERRTDGKFGGTRPTGDRDRDGRRGGGGGGASGGRDRQRSGDGNSTSRPR